MKIHVYITHDNGLIIRKQVHPVLPSVARVELNLDSIISEDERFAFVGYLIELRTVELSPPPAPGPALCECCGNPLRG